jgi:hypothetical protein
LAGWRLRSYNSGGLDGNPHLPSVSNTNAYCDSYVHANSHGNADGDSNGYTDRDSASYANPECATSADARA